MRLLPSRFHRSATLGRRSAVTSMLLAFAVVVVLVTIFILTALDRIAEYANRLDDGRSLETTTGAIQTFEEQLHATLNDYAAWDDAAQFVYADDRTWVVSNYGDMTANSDLFDVAIVMDMNQNVVMAYQDGAPVSWAPRDFSTVRSGRCSTRRVPPARKACRKRPVSLRPKRASRPSAWR